MAHHHFTRDDRVFLAKLIKEGLSVRAAANILGFFITLSRINTILLLQHHRDLVRTIQHVIFA